MQTCMWPSWCRCHSLSLASVKSRLVLPFWYRLTWVVPEKGPLNGCVCYTLCFKKLSPFYFLNNSVKNKSILMIFRRLNPAKNWQKNLTDLLTHLSLYFGKSKRSFSTALFIHTFLLYFLRYLRRKQTVTHLAITPKSIATLTCEKQKLFSSWWRSVVFLQTLGVLKRASCALSSVALKRSGCDVCQLKCQANNVTASFHSNHLLHWYMLPVFFVDTDQSHSTPRCAEIQPMVQQAAATSRNSSVSVHALLL